jgi:hypothetical protein
VLIMNFYEKLPNNLLIDFYNEINKNIEKGILTKSMYYELGLIISVMDRKGIQLDKPFDFEQVVDKKVMKNISA